MNDIPVKLLRFEDSFIGRKSHKASKGYVKEINILLDAFDEKEMGLRVRAHSREIAKHNYASLEPDYILQYVRLRMALIKYTFTAERARSSYR